MALIFPYSSDEEVFEQLSDQSDQENQSDGLELQQFQPEQAPQPSDRDQPSTSTSTDPTDDDAQPAEGACNAGTSSTPVLKPSRKRKNPYALGLNQLPVAFQRFLAEVKSFFTQKVNLQRQRAAISASTYAKVQERILCKFISLYFLKFGFFGDKFQLAGLHA